MTVGGTWSGSQSTERPWDSWGRCPEFKTMEEYHQGGKGAKGDCKGEWKGAQGECKGAKEDWKGACKGAKGDCMGAKGDWKGSKGDWKGAKGSCKGAKGDWMECSWKGAKGDCKGAVGHGKAAGKGHQGKGKGKGKGKGEYSLPEGVRMESFIVHTAADGSEVHLDVYLPSVKSSVKAPALLYTHGSAFGGGHMVRRKPPMELIEPLILQQGYAIAVAEHREGPRVGYLGVLHDGKAALRQLRGKANDLGIDSERIAVMGHSSGAWMALMLAATSNSRTAMPSTVDLDGGLGAAEFVSLPVNVTCCVDFFGPTDFLSMDCQREGSHHMVHDDAWSPESQLLGFPLQTKPEECKKAHPITYVRAVMAPTFVCHGSADSLVPCGQSRELVEKLGAEGVPHVYHELAGADHGGAEFKTSEVVQKVVEWLEQHNSA